MKKYKFDYDNKNDNLFLYNPKSKSKASIEIDDIVIDYDSKKNISGIELFNASKFFDDLGLDKDKLDQISDCKISVKNKNSFVRILIVLTFNSNETFSTPFFVPSIKEPGPVALT